MKLSVLIPTYNYECCNLVRQILAQLPEDGEVIVGDDCSTYRIVSGRLKEMEDPPRFRVIRPEHNLGRAAIRNALAYEAKGDWLLFIDADAEVKSPTFIADYLAATEEDRPSTTTDDGQSSLVYVVCGGTGNAPRCPRPAARLRYDYEVAAERRLTLEHRRRNPYAQFTTFNFLIRRTLFLSVKFDERCKEYGHEDTQFGLELKQRSIAIKHIDNKLMHMGLEDAEVYLEKTETALRSLASMDLAQRKHVRVSALALRLERWHLLWIVRKLFKLTKPLLRYNLLGYYPSQTLFAFYKLGYYAQLSRS